MIQPKLMKYRHELKYQISDAQVQMLKNRITHLIPADRHAGADGTYTIRSLYFDDYENRCLRENEDGTDPREKFRIRIYNHSDQRITLECKRKERGKTHKTSCPLTRQQTELLMQGKIDTIEYLKRLPAGQITDRDTLIAVLERERQMQLMMAGVPVPQDGGAPSQAPGPSDEAAPPVRGGPGYGALQRKINQTGEVPKEG